MTVRSGQVDIESAFQKLSRLTCIGEGLIRSLVLRGDTWKAAVVLAGRFAMLRVMYLVANIQDQLLLKR